MNSNDVVQLEKPLVYPTVSRSYSINDVLKRSTTLESTIAFSVPATPYAVWLRFDIRNNTHEPVIVWFDDSGLDTIQVFTFVGEAQNGNVGEQSNVLQEYAGLTFSSRTASGLPTTMIYCARVDTALQHVYIRLVSREPVFTMLYCGTEHAMRMFYNKRLLLYGILVGMMLAIVCYNGFLSLMMQSSTYALYTLYGLSTATYVAYVTGMIVPIAGEYIAEVLHGRVLQIVMCISFLSVAFAMRFFHITTTLVAMLLPGYILLILLSIVWGAFFVVRSANTVLISIAIVLSMVSVLYCVVVSVMSGMRGNRAAWIYLTAWSLVLCSLFIVPPSLEGWIPFSPAMLALPNIAAAVELLLMSFALAYRIRQLQRERQQVLLENERILREQQTLLERQVRERTQELAEANIQLSRANEEIQRQLEVQAEQAQQIEYANVELQEAMSNLALMNNELQEKNQALVNAEQFRLNMLSVVSHDLKNPIVSITGIASVLLDSPKLDERMREALRYIAESGERMGMLVRDLLDTAARSMGNIVLHKAPVELCSLTSGVVAHHQYAAERKHQSFLLGYRCEVWVMGDTQRLFQVFDNLVSNAIKYSPEGGTIWIDVDVADDTHAIWSIRDEGIGFTEEDKLKGFEFFQRLSAQPTSGESSHGIGLAIARQIVELHQGTINIVSKEGEGARIVVQLPLLQQAT
ncbi:MAG: sensor histidine kinase [Candidatus Kapabacteria bacterium]|nr:sensor histidine kinase [Candidatus Kapabacteria bacterium]